MQRLFSGIIIITSLSQSDIASATMHLCGHHIACTDTAPQVTCLEVTRLACGGAGVQTRTSTTGSKVLTPRSPLHGSPSHGLSVGPCPSGCTVATCDCCVPAASDCRVALVQVISWSQLSH